MITTFKSPESIGHLSAYSTSKFQLHEYLPKFSDVDSLFEDVIEIGYSIFHLYPKHKNTDNTEISSDLLFSMLYKRSIETMTSILALNRLGLFAQSAVLTRSIYELWVTLNYISIDKDVNYKQLIYTHKKFINNLNRIIKVYNPSHIYNTEEPLEGNELPNRETMCKKIDDYHNSIQYTKDYKLLYKVLCDYAHNGLIHIQDSLDFDSSTLYICDTRMNLNRHDIHFSLFHSIRYFIGITGLVCGLHEFDISDELELKLKSLPDRVTNISTKFNY